jgi:hypothetical protein
MVVFDTTFILLLLDSSVPVPSDPETGKPIEHGRDRVEYLISRLSDAGTEILIPTPVLAEALVRAGPATPDYLSKIRAIRSLRIGNFDQRAAVEVSLLTGAALKVGNKRGKARKNLGKRSRLIVRLSQ